MYDWNENHFSGVDADNKEQLKSKLADIVKNLIKERQEYHALIEETKELNYELYKMMISADENHSGALYKSDVLSTTPEEICTSKSDQNLNSEEKKLPLNKTTKRKGSENTFDLTPEKDSHLRRTKSEKVRKRSFKKAGRVATATVKAKTIISKDNKVFKTNWIKKLKFSTHSPKQVVLFMTSMGIYRWKVL